VAKIQTTANATFDEFVNVRGATAYKRRRHHFGHARHWHLKETVVKK